MTSGRAQFTGLVVEDEWLLRMELADELSAVGWKILEAGTGEAALALIADGTPLDFLVTDIRLPGPVDGWTVAERFRTCWPKSAVIYVSANPELPARRVSYSRFIGKPCELSLLLQTCDELVLP
jgi:CheY-like chemotaxis protein